MPTLQRRNDEMVNLLRADFQHRYEPNFAWVNSVSSNLLLPQLRGFWPTSSVNEANVCYDLSGQGRHLTPGEGVPDWAIYNLLPYAAFVSATSDHLARADENGLSSAGGMTIGGWFRYDTDSIGAIAVYMAKWGAQSDNREYRLWKDAADLPNFSISSNGVAVVTATGATPLVMGSWYFIVGRLVSGASVDLFVNDVAASRATLTEYNQATAVTAPFASTAALSVGADESGTANFLDGAGTLMHLCCATGTGNPVASDVIVWSLFEQTRAGFNC